MSFLDDVVAGVRQSLDEGYYDVRADANEKPMSAKDGKQSMSLKATLQNRFTLIAEIKPRSPTAGVLFKGSAAKLAKTYAEAGAGALSVLCEPKRFNGKLGNLTEAKNAAMNLPVLAKDFVVSEKQLKTYAAHGADAALLIYELFERKKTEKPLDEMIDVAHELGLEVLLEVHGTKGLAEALRSKTDVVGINNRNLDDLSLNVLHFHNVLDEYGMDRASGAAKPLIAESGFQSREDVTLARAAGLRGVLVGSGLLASGNPGDNVRKLL